MTLVELILSALFPHLNWAPDDLAVVKMASTTYGGECAGIEPKRKEVVSEKNPGVSRVFRPLLRNSAQHTPDVGMLWKEGIKIKGKRWRWPRHHVQPCREARVFREEGFPPTTSLAFNLDSLRVGWKLGLDWPSYWSKQQKIGNGRNARAPPPSPFSRRRQPRLFLFFLPPFTITLCCHFSVI